MYQFSGQFMTFPGLSRIFDPLKSPLGPPWGRVGQICLGSNQPHNLSEYACQVGCGLTVVSEKRGGGTDTRTHACTHTHTDKGTLQLDELL